MMKKRSFYRLLPLLLLVVLCGLGVAGAALRISMLPERIYLIGGGSRVLDVGLPMSMTLKDAQQTAGDAAIAIQPAADTALEISSEGTGQTTAQLKLFGLLPIKEIDITAVEQKVLIPGGQSIGVMLHTKGALVVGFTDISRENGTRCNPAAEAGLLAGDLILEYGGEEIVNASHLSALIEEHRNTRTTVCILRDGEQLLLEIGAVQDAESGKYKLGAWLRDSTVGVGTLTFYDPESGYLAGLGHAITDYDTEEILTVREGSIVTSRIVGVTKGEAGEPGALKGDFSGSTQVLGNICSNTEYGIYGQAERPLASAQYDYLEAADRSEVKRGDATILCTVESGEVQAYSCKIKKLFKQESQEQRSFIVEIDDPALLERTGGIVQGMSGSPVIQNGKLIGAVTHVFVDDPKCGYGVYIDWMLQEVQELE